MLILPKVFIFAVDHELPPVIRLIFWGGIKGFMSVWPLWCMFRKGQVCLCPLSCVSPGTVS